MRPEFGAVVGVETPIPITDRFMVVPGVRMHMIKRRFEDFFLGLGAVNVRPAILGRVAF